MWLASSQAGKEKSREREATRDLWIEAALFLFGYPVRQNLIVGAL
ncbi:MAG: hypothetical protein QOI87_2899, partial [Bradyrhizobium sp.]|nr:hypothetical protein [Bradyrhizobium sp.]